MHIYHEGVTDIDHKRTKIRANGPPLVVHKDLEPTDVVLVEDGQGCGVAVGPCAQGLIRFLARWVVIEPHD